MYARKGVTAARENRMCCRNASYFDVRITYSGHLLEVCCSTATRCNSSSVGRCGRVCLIHGNYSIRQSCRMCHLSEFENEFNRSSLWTPLLPAGKRQWSSCNHGVQVAHTNIDGIDSWVVRLDRSSLCAFMRSSPAHLNSVSFTSSCIEPSTYTATCISSLHPGPALLEVERRVWLL